ncbi:MAG: hypothetical protein QM817_31875 [Archangium sp.]
MRRQILELSLVLGVVLVGCKKDEPAAVPPPADTVSAAANPFSLSIAAKGAVAAGQGGSALINVAAKDGFHVNPDYPVAFKVTPSSTVKFSGDRVPLTASKKTPCAEKAEDSCAAEFELPFTAQEAGAAKLDGIIAFSVCSAEKCLIQKEPLTLALTVN